MTDRDTFIFEHAAEIIETRTRVGRELQADETKRAARRLAGWLRRTIAPRRFRTTAQLKQH